MTAASEFDQLSFLVLWMHTTKWPMLRKLQAYECWNYGRRLSFLFGCRSPSFETTCAYLFALMVAVQGDGLMEYR
ncbi:hypothetical protein V6N13_088278 [Hibiscus sabdariffa]